MEKNKEIELSIIIVNYNSGKYLNRTIRSIYEANPEPELEIIIIDNKSTDSSLTDTIMDFPKLKIIELDTNKGFSRANNVGADIASGKYLLFLNNDTEVLEGSIDTLLKVIKENPEYGIVSPVLLYGNGSAQLNYGYDPNIISEFFTKYFLRIIFKFSTRLKPERFEKDVDWISGACFIIASELYKKMNGFDDNFFLYYEDADLGKRVRSEGLRNHITSGSRVIHFLGKSTTPVFNKMLPIIKKGHLYYYRKHNGQFSLHFLRLYLLLKFRIKKSVAVITGNKERSTLFRETISVIKDFK